MPRRPTLEFWFEFASAYSYLAAMRIEALAEAAGVTLRWRPFLLGPVFAAQGWTTSPFNLYPAKGRHMWRDLAREAARLGLPPIAKPESFPQNSLAATRVAVHGAEEPWIGTYVRAVYEAEFAKGASIAEPAAISALLNGLELDGPALIRASTQEPVKSRLRSIGEEAKSRGLFGAPSFLTEDGELFWGNDRLEQALAWAVGERPAGLR